MFYYSIYVLILVLFMVNINERIEYYNIITKD